eukprot:4298413-Prymnesium_polylepis.1
MSNARSPRGVLSSTMGISPLVAGRVASRRSRERSGGSRRNAVPSGSAERSITYRELEATSEEFILSTVGSA